MISAKKQKNLQKTSDFPLPLMVTSPFPPLPLQFLCIRVPSCEVSVGINLHPQTWKKFELEKIPLNSVLILVIGRRMKEKKSLNAHSGASFQPDVISSHSLMGRFSIHNAEQRRQECSRIVHVPHSHWIVPKHLGFDWCKENYSSPSTFAYTGSSV